MDSFKEQTQKENREQKAKEVKIVFTDKEYKNFNVVDDEGNLKYNGYLASADPHKDDNCTCPSFTNNNNSKAEGDYSATHGFAFQCKHLIAARIVRNTLQQVDVLQSSLKEAFANDKTHTQKLAEQGFESRLIQRDLLL